MTEKKVSQRRSYTKEEKSKLIEAYKASRTPKKQWCQNNGVGLSTLQRWLSKEQQIKPQSVPTWLSLPIATVEKTTTSLAIQVGKCNVSVDANTDLNLLGAVLNMVVKL